MLNMTKGSNQMVSVLYDCVWVVQPPQEFAFKSHLSVRVEQFDRMGKQNFQTPMYLGRIFRPLSSV